MFKRIIERSCSIGISQNFARRPCPAFVDENVDNDIPLLQAIEDSCAAFGCSRSFAITGRLASTVQLLQLLGDFAQFRFNRCDKDDRG